MSSIPADSSAASRSTAREPALRHPEPATLGALDGDALDGDDGHIEAGRPGRTVPLRRRKGCAVLDFDEGDELRALRAAVADLGARYGQRYFLEQARSGGRTDALWAEVGKAGFLGVNVPEEFGGGGRGLVELSIVLEELGAAG